MREILILLVKDSELATRIRNLRQLGRPSPDFQKKFLVQALVPSPDAEFGCELSLADSAEDLLEFSLRRLRECLDFEWSKRFRTSIAFFSASRSAKRALLNRGGRYA